jgi:hypothetical protein
LEVEAMRIEEDDIECTNISGLDVEALLLEAKERIKENAMLEDKYREICKQLTFVGNIDKDFAIKDELLCQKNRVYVPQGLQQRVMHSEHDSMVEGHFGRVLGVLL